MCAARGCPATRIGVVDSGLGPDAGQPAGAQVLQLDAVHGQTLRWTLDELREASERTLPAALG